MGFEPWTGPYTLSSDSSSIGALAWEAELEKSVGFLPVGLPYEVSMREDLEEQPAASLYARLRLAPAIAVDKGGRHTLRHACLPRMRALPTL